MDGWIERGCNGYIHFYCPLGVSGPDQTVTCSDSELKTVLNRSLVLSHYPTANDNMAATNVGMVRVRERVGGRGRERDCVISQNKCSLKYLNYIPNINNSHFIISCRHLLNFLQSIVLDFRILLYKKHMPLHLHMMHSGH